MGDTQSRHKEAGTEIPEWVPFFFVEHLYALLLLILLAPAAVGFHLLRRGDIISGLLVVIFCISVYVWLAASLHQRKRLRLQLSLPYAAVLMGLFAFWFFRA